MKFDNLRTELCRLLSRVERNCNPRHASGTSVLLFVFDRPVEHVQRLKFWKHSMIWTITSKLRQKYSLRSGTNMLATRTLCNLTVYTDRPRKVNRIRISARICEGNTEVCGLRRTGDGGRQAKWEEGPPAPIMAQVGGHLAPPLPPSFSLQV